MQPSRDLTSHEHRRIVDVLQRNVDLFAWQPSDMSGIHPSIIYHKLAMCLQGHALWPKNACATYQRLMDQVFKQQIG